MVVERATRRHRHQGLTQRVLVAAVDRVRAATAARRARRFQMLSRERGERDLLHRWRLLSDDRTCKYVFEPNATNNTILVIGGIGKPGLRHIRVRNGCDRRMDT